MDGAAIVIEVLEIVAELLKKRPAAEVRDQLVKLAAGWPEPIGDAELDAAVKAGLARSAVP